MAERLSPEIERIEHTPYFALAEPLYDCPTAAAVERVVWRIVAHAKREALSATRTDIKSRIDTFRALGADEGYMSALNDAWGLVANRERDLSTPGQTAPADHLTTTEGATEVEG